MKNNISVYLSKSNLVSPDELIFTRAILNENYEKLNEFQGGVYNSGLVWKSDVFISLPYETSRVEYFNKTLQGGYYVGKGQYTELKIALERGKPCYCVSSVDSHGMLLEKIVGVSINDLNDYKKKHASVILTTETLFLEREPNCSKSITMNSIKFNPGIILKKLRNEK